MKYALLSLFLAASMMANTQEYSILKSNRNYMSQVEQAYKTKAFTKEQLQNALTNENLHPLSDLLRVSAHYEVGNMDDVKRYAENITPENKEVYAYFPFVLTLCDALISLEEYDRVLEFLPRSEIVMLRGKEKNDAYYYRAIATYLKDGTIGDEFKMIMNLYKQTKEIYYKKGHR